MSLQSHTNLNSHPLPKESELSEVHQSCPLCYSTARVKQELVLQESPVVNMKFCTSCRGSYSDRFPNEGYLEKLYNPTHYKSDMLQSNSSTLSYAASIVKYIVSEYSVESNIKIIDYGGSTGALTKTIIQLLARLGYENVQGTIVDFCEERDEGVVNFVNTKNLKDIRLKYNVLIASAVLEHLTDVPQVVKSLLEKSEKSGLFFIRTPFDVPLAKLIPGYKTRWPNHLHDMGPEYLENFLGTYKVNGVVLSSRPSIVESSFSQKPLRTLAAYLLKLPGHLECLTFKKIFNYNGIFWPLVGGWQTVYRVKR